MKLVRSFQYRSDDIDHLQCPITYAPILYAPILYAPIFYAPILYAPILYAPILCAPIFYAPIFYAPIFMHLSIMHLSCTHLSFMHLKLNLQSVIRISFYYWLKICVEPIRIEQKQFYLTRRDHYFFLLIIFYVHLSILRYDFFCKNVKNSGKIINVFTFFFAQTQILNLFATWYKNLWFEMFKV